MLYKSDGIIFENVSTPRVFNNDSLLKLTGQNLEQKVLAKILGFCYRITKKQFSPYVNKCTILVFGDFEAKSKNF